MSQAGTVKAAIVGLGFGAEFIPIYQKLPGVEMYGVCRRDEAGLNEVADAFGIEKRYTRFEDVLADPQVDFVHINSPIPDHAPMTLAALASTRPSPRRRSSAAPCTR